MNKLLVILAIAVLPAASACVSTEAYQNALDHNRALQNEKADLERAYAELEADRNRLRSAYEQASRSATDAAWLEQRTQELEELLGRLQTGTLDIEGVGLRETNEGPVFEVEGELLFQPGQAEITKEGRATLARLVPVLARDPRKLRIQGHTDADPIRRSRWKSNLHLSAARSLAVAEALIAAGVDEEDVAVAGYGPHAPRPDNPGGDPDTRKRWNRRVEILLLDD